MNEAVTIDFLRGEFGGDWLLIVLLGITFGLAALRPATVKTFRQDGWKGSIKKFSFGFCVGLMIAIPITVCLAVWQRWPPQHFISLRVESEHIRLGQRWPEAGIVIPLNEIKSLSRIRERENSLRWSAGRIVIETRKETFQSYGYSQLSDDELKIWERLMASFTEHNHSQTPDPARTNHLKLHQQP